MRYYLVCPFDEKTGKTGPCYWMKDGGDRWIHFVNGAWIEKKDGDVVKDVVRVRDVSELDWSQTPLRNPSSSSGWLSRGGRFFGCPPNWHDKFAAYVIGLKVDEMESQGWVRVLNSRYYVNEKRLSEEQINWLSTKGYKVYD